ncbi:MAG TPA: hypothetical protein VHP83_22555 [Aggregatilineaceae bacterium]|nr:hypothetical protein [Aggregatilineaceae bacterium]
MKKKLKFKLLKDIIVIFLIGFLLFRVVSACNPLPPWTEHEIEERCALTPIHGLSNGIDNYLQSGWDSSHHFYATEGIEAIGIIDPHNGRCCTLGIYGAWFRAAFDKDTYDVYFHNQYGWSATTSLNLQRWEVTTIVSGSCFQWMGCRTLDPPQVTVLGYCDPKQVYDPAGLD